MTAVNTSVPATLYRRFNLWSKRVGLARKMAIALTVAALTSAVATYAALSGSVAYGLEAGTILILLNIDLALFLMLGTLVARRLVQIWIERRHSAVGSRLYTRFVLLFSLLTVMPAIIISVFSVLFFNFGIQAWFSDRVNNALKNSMTVAEAYLKEHQQAIRGDILAMAQDLNRSAPRLMDNPKRFRRVVTAQGSLRSLSEVMVFDSSGRVLVRWKLGFVLADDPVPLWTLNKAQSGEPVLLTNETDDRLRAIIKLDRFVDAYLYVARFVEPEVLIYIERTKRAYSQYKKIEGQRSSIEITFAMIFMLVTFLLLLAAIWIGLSFAARLSLPISNLVDAAERVRTGDLSARVEEGPEGDELGLLSRAFNRMTQQLDTQRGGLVDANRQLDERREFIETVLSGVSSGVIGLDSDGRVNVANRAASELFSIDLETRMGEKLPDIVPELVMLTEQAVKQPAHLAQGQVTVNQARGTRTLLIRISAERGVGIVHGFVVTFDDITELLSAQRKAAWADLARRIAHEIKNPLTPIRLAADRLRRKYLKEISSDPNDFLAYTETIMRQVDDIGRLVDEFSNFARMPAPEMQRNNLEEICRDAILMQTNANRDIDFVPKLGDGKTQVECDQRQIHQAVINLLQNAVESIEARVQRPGKELSRGRIEISIGHDTENGQYSVDIADNGRGLPEEQRDRLTEPYVTTREGGTGLGLAIVTKIMEDHCGQLIMQNGHDGGALIQLKFSAPDTQDKPESDDDGHGVKHMNKRKRAAYGI